MKPRVILAAAVAAVLAMPGAARASATGQVTVDQFTYTLTDLDPNDGVTPSIVFLPAGSGSLWSGVSLGYNYNNAPGGANFPAVGTAPASGGLDRPGMSLRGSVSGLGDPGAISLSAFASVDQAGGASGDATADASAWLGFILSPNTALNLAVADHFIASAVGYPNDSIDRLTAELTVRLRGQDGAFLGTFDDFVGVYGGEDGVDRVGQVVGTYANTGSASLSGTLQLDGNVWAVAVGGPVAPVPEPANIAMLAAGLPLLLALRRRNGRDTRT